MNIEHPRLPGRQRTSDNRLASGWRAIARWKRSAQNAERQQYSE
jgi:hypothetical protein